MLEEVLQGRCGEPPHRLPGWLLWAQPLLTRQALGVDSRDGVGAKTPEEVVVGTPCPRRAEWQTNGRQGLLSLFSLCRGHAGGRLAGAPVGAALPKAPVQQVVSASWV